MTPTETITLDEVTSLLEQCAARDQRTTGDADIEAWWYDLNTARVTYRDAVAAVNHYFAIVWPSQEERNRFRVTAPKVIEIVKGFRKDRLATANWEYVPTEGETGEEFVRNYNQQRDAILNGQTPPGTIGSILRPRPIAELIAATAKGSRLPADVVEQANRDLERLPAEIATVLKPLRNPARTVRCPHCGAGPNEACHNGNGRALGGGKAFHPSRTDQFAIRAISCSACRAQAGQHCREIGHECTLDADGYCTTSGHSYSRGVHTTRIEDATGKPVEQ